MTVDQWIAAYERAWLEKDADAAAALFTPEGTYRERPLDEAYVGQGSPSCRIRTQNSTAARRPSAETIGVPKPFPPHAGWGG